MVSFFHKNSLGSAVISLLILAVGLWVATGNVSMIYHPHALLQIPFAPQVQHFSFLMAMFIALAFMLPLPFVFNRMYNRNKLLQVTTYVTLPVFALLLVLVGNLSNSWSTFPGVLLASLALYRSFFIGNTQNGIRTSFDCGLLLGLASLFNFALLFMLLVVFNGLFYQRKFYWREWLAPLIGAGLPLLFLAVFYPGAYRSFKGVFDFTHLFDMRFSIAQLMVMAGVGLVVVAGVPTLLAKMPTSTVSERKSIYLLGWMAFTGGATALLSGNLFLLFVFSIPFSTYMISNFLLMAKRRWLADAAFFILFAMVVYNQLKDYLNFNV